MKFWYNPSFLTWLFAKHRKRWAKWTTATGSIFSVPFGVLLFAVWSSGQIAGNLSDRRIAQHSVCGLVFCILPQSLLCRARIKKRLSNNELTHASDFWAEGSRKNKATAAESRQAPIMVGANLAPMDFPPCIKAAAPREINAKNKRANLT
jgi:hypothetical protein